MSETTMAVPAKWTDDCQGKKDYDGELVCISTRYWPRGGGFFVVRRSGGGVEIDENPRPDLKPAAHATIYLGSTADEHYDDAEKLIDAKFEAETQEEVQRAVEAWAAEQFARIATALRRAFAEPADAIR